MKNSISSLVSFSAVLVLLVIISEYAPRTNGQVHHRFSGWRPGGKRSDSSDLNQNTRTIDRPPQPCQSNQDQDLDQVDFDILGDLRRAADRMRLLHLFNLSKSRLSKGSTENNADDQRPTYEDYLSAGL
ncbi:uncharacterized protein [Diadema setosum]|uniref:uncharacterized protein n=1 Tax=Diadema setosum TaxID=31175 RepID=UPI003B3ADB33